MKLTIACALFLSLSVTMAQEAPTDTISQKKKADRLLLYSIGNTAAIYRDFATSPLFYIGPGINLGLATMRKKERSELLYEMDMFISGMEALMPESSFFPTSVFSVFLNNQVYVHYLRKQEKLSSEIFDIELGGALQSNFNLRANPELLNAAAGIEVLANFMFTGRATMDVSRKTSREVSWWKIKYTLRPERRSLSFQGYAGILNFNYRPGYAYLSESELNGSDTSPLAYFFGSHRWSMNGWRLGSRLEFTRYRPSGNGTRVAYLWDAVHAPGRFEPFQMASHTLRFSLLINNNLR